MSRQPVGVRDAGSRALLLELATLEDVLAYHQHLMRSPLPGQREAVAAARTVLLRFDSPDRARRAREQLRELRVSGSSIGDAQALELDVVYDGEDLAEVAELVGMSQEALVQWHTGAEWTGAFGGFAPGFTYCVPTDSERALDIPRRATPRTALPAGSVAVAGEFSAIYPRVSPGGWRLIGRTPSQMWDLHRASPALVRPGDVVRYRAVRDAVRLVDSPQSKALRADDRPAPPVAAETALDVVFPGLQTLIQDFGREGSSDLGVSRAGAADEAAMRQGNRLVGNSYGASVLETLLGGLELQARRTVVLAVCGAESKLSVTADDGTTRHPALRAPFALTAGETLSLGAPEDGLRSVIAVRGGLLAEPVLGSVSADTMSGLGPAPLRSGDELAVGAAPSHPVGEPEPSTLPTRQPDGTITLRVRLGPRDDWFAQDEIDRLQFQRWQVGQESNRIGLRLGLADQPSGSEAELRPLSRARRGELPSEGVARGSVQIPPSGLPVLFLNDHPVTGGYPVIGVVIDEDLPAAAQLAPGDAVRLRAVVPDASSPDP